MRDDDNRQPAPPKGGPLSKFIEGALNPDEIKEERANTIASKSAEVLTQEADVAEVIERADERIDAAQSQVNEASNEIKESEKEISDARDLAAANVKNAEDAERKGLLELKYAGKAYAEAEEGIYQITEPSDRTREMKKAHSSYKWQKRRETGKAAAITGIFSALATFAVIKGPGLYEDAENWLENGAKTTISNDNPSATKPAAIKSDGNYYVQLGQASKTDPNKVLDGHKSCPNEHGTISSLWKGKAYPTKAAADKDVIVAKKEGYTGAWSVHHVNCD
jgi:hypothetical protein